MICPFCCTSNEESAKECVKCKADLEYAKSIGSVGTEGKSAHNFSMPENQNPARQLLALQNWLAKSNMSEDMKKMILEDEKRRMKL